MRDGNIVNLEKKGFRDSVLIQHMIRLQFGIYISISTISWGTSIPLEDAGCCSNHLPLLKLIPGHRGTYQHLSRRKIVCFVQKYSPILASEHRFTLSRICPAHLSTQISMLAAVPGAFGVTTVIPTVYAPIPMPSGVLGGHVSGEEGDHVEPHALLPKRTRVMVVGERKGIACSEIQQLVAVPRVVCGAWIRGGLPGKSLTTRPLLSSARETIYTGFLPRRQQPYQSVARWDAWYDQKGGRSGRLALRGEET